MTIKIFHKNKILKKTSSNLVLFVDDKYKTGQIKKFVSNFEHSYITDLLKTSDFDKKLLVFELSSKKRIFLISIKKNLRSCDIENLGAEFYGHINYGKNSEYSINSDSIISKNQNFMGYFLHGFKLRSYEFNKYKSKKIIEKL